MKRAVFFGASSALAQATKKKLQAEGWEVIGISTKSDVLGYNELHTVESYHKDTLPSLDGPIDAFCYFPGTISLKPFHRFSLNEIQHDFEINVLGAIQTLQHCLPQLKLATNASVVFISSVASQLGLGFHASVAISKGALESLTVSLATEYLPKIRVNCLAPSLADTPLGERFLGTPEKMEAMQKRNPMQKIGTPEEIADSLQFLLSDRSSWMTGQVIHLDGGMVNLKP
jgi:3-oxoacyl-[acyl-carrier protein] reductase